MKDERGFGRGPADDLGSVLGHAAGSRGWPRTRRSILVQTAEFSCRRSNLCKATYAATMAVYLLSMKTIEAFGSISTARFR